MIYGSGSTTADIENQDRFEKRWNIAEGLILGVIACVILAGLLGLLGGGWLAQAEASAVGATLRYPRILHRSATSRMELTVSPSKGPLAVRLSADQARQISTILPHPLTASAGTNATTFNFAVPPDEATTIIFEMQPTTAGLLRSTIDVLGRTIAFNQLVLP